jgi:legumain
MSYPPQDMVNGKHIKSCLGDLYSVNWMQDSDTATGIKSTLDVQTAMVKKLTNKSHVTEYGTVGTFSATDTCDEYQGDTDNTAADADVAKTPARDTAAMQHAVDSRDIPLVTAFYQYMWAEEGADKTALAAKLTALVKAREWADKVFGSVVTSLQSARKSSPVLSTVSETSACEKRVYAAVKEHCGWFDEYSLKYSSPLIERCADVPFADIEDMLRKHCTH